MQNRTKLSKNSHLDFGINLRLSACHCEMISCESVRKSIPKTEDEDSERKDNKSRFDQLKKPIFINNAIGSTVTTYECGRRVRGVRPVLREDEGGGRGHNAPLAEMALHEQKIRVCLKAPADVSSSTDDLSLCTDSCHIFHQESSEVWNCGLQLWPCSILLHDWARDKLPLLFVEAPVVLEFGAGVGVLPCLLSLGVTPSFRRYIATDVSTDVLQVAKKNIHQNVADGIRCDLEVFDLCQRSWPNTWEPSLISACENADLVLASDVVYDPVVTEGLVWWLRYLLERKPNRIVMVAAESRLNFTLEHMRVVDVAVDKFISDVESAGLRCDELDTSSLPTYTDIARPDASHLFRVRLPSKTSSDNNYSKE